MVTLEKASFYCRPRKFGRYLNIRLVGPNMTLTLCEVEVFSYSNGKYYIHYSCSFSPKSFELIVEGKKERNS